MAEPSSTPPKIFLNNELKSSKRLLIFGISILLGVFIWHSYTTVSLHKEYQNELMNSVTDQVIMEYQSHIETLRNQINHYQWVYQNEINELVRQGTDSTTQDYLDLLEQLRLEIEDVRLFSVIDENGNGVFKHITGDFLADCKEEINSTLELSSQEHLFLHRSQKSVHYDLLEPLVGGKGFIFVAFQPTKLIEILSGYRLPQQELFLLRQDLIGKVELSSIKQIQDKTSVGVTMTETDVAKFNYLKEIPGTRWQVAIRLEGSYIYDLQKETYLRALILWGVISTILMISFDSRRRRLLSQYKIMKKLQHTESHDSLTGLMNRQLFVKRLNQQLGQLTVGVGGVFLVDIDRFQVFNNALGFGKGDESLKLITNLIRDVCPKKASISRISNDQFAILVDDINHNSVCAFAEKMRKEIANLDLSEIADKLTLTCSVAAIQLDDSFIDGDHVTNALMFTIKLAKDKGRNRVQLYQSSDPELIRHAGEMEIFKTVRGALTDSTFILYRQRIVAAQQLEKNESYEVLLRMTDEDGNMVSPALFIPVAEQHSLAVELDKWVINQTFTFIKETKTDDHYSINLSGQSLADPNMALYVRECLVRHNVSPRQITLEITETYAITHLNAAVSFITELTNLGCRFALDDFGSGLSSFSYLQKLPVQKLKIDGVFIKDIANSRRNQAFVRTMVDLAKSMDMETVAEFVETEEEFSILKSLGIDYCQGYYFHAPEPWQKSS